MVPVKREFHLICHKSACYFLGIKKDYFNWLLYFNKKDDHTFLSESPETDSDQHLIIANEN